MREGGGPVAAVLQSQAHTAGQLTTDDCATVSAISTVLAVTVTGGNV